ncbi:hypothetical protein B0T26DRAFT_682586 [Lasiosphaeria miniovina]|uniref:Uncharacterized protein n=1 Tax=Lasiosphaeria miniovina TaxID=1954250 RepID=A0AA40BF19_9PEZI|nr:uncharacterized protein B0T26DRAFT_682586 [Lasiosphaeria miniovina]KAK0733001.1 hypothetical protein B0T26DRAFT_682586 [Lasiosphaeria miniovina]
MNRWPLPTKSYLEENPNSLLACPLTKKSITLSWIGWTTRLSPEVLSNEPAPARMDPKSPPISGTSMPPLTSIRP